MATDLPSAPELVLDESSRTLDSLRLQFVAPGNNGGSTITGYQLWRDQGIQGSPSQMIYDGTERPENLSLFVDRLQESYTYTFDLYSMNEIFTSSVSAQLVIKIGVVPSKPAQPTHLFEEYDGGEITIAWGVPELDGGWPIESYDLWIDNGNGVWPTEPTTVMASALLD